MLENAGVIGGADMTPEAALAKLSYILAKEGLTTDLRKVLFFCISHYFACFFIKLLFAFFCIMLILYMKKGMRREVILNPYFNIVHKKGLMF